MRVASAEEAEAFLEQTAFIWHQSWEVVPGVRTPGVHDIDLLWHEAGLPENLEGRTVLDVGTTNGGAAFLAEQRGASRVVAVDLFDPAHFGFDALSAFLESDATYVRASVYELATVLGGEQFDIVLFWGVLYHLRHPLLALDQVRALAREEVYIETALSDGTLPPDARSEALVSYFRKDEFAGDSSNWFVPTLRALNDWCESSGLSPVRSSVWPSDSPTRGQMVCRVVPGDPEWQSLSYELPLRVSAARPTPVASGSTPSRTTSSE
jgi:tRNA (mo5U34)-methyltransferase